MEKQINHQIEVVADMNDLRKLVSEYGKIGSNLNQIAKHFNSGGSHPTIWIAANNIAHNILTIFSNLLFVFLIPKFNSHFFLFYLFPSDTLKSKSAFFFFLP